MTLLASISSQGAIVPFFSFEVFCIFLILIDDYKLCTQLQLFSAQNHIEVFLTTKKKVENCVHPSQDNEMMKTENKIQCCHELMSNQCIYSVRNFSRRW